ncbi:hypothetical protein TNCV_809091 [Trichonephila clavipes]|nr:hypothetical protein TNCV_809091 [Trichonephila clavipes]
MSLNRLWLKVLTWRRHEKLGASSELIEFHLHRVARRQKFRHQGHFVIANRLLLLLLLKPPDRQQHQTKVHEIHRGFTPVVSLSFEHHAGDSMILLCSTSILRENTLKEASNLSSPSTNLTRGLVARRLLRILPCRKGTIHLQASIPSLRFKPRPYGTAVSDTNHYTEGGYHLLTSPSTSQCPLF